MVHRGARTIFVLHQEALAHLVVFPQASLQRSTDYSFSFDKSRRPAYAPNLSILSKDHLLASLCARHRFPRYMSIVLSMAVLQHLTPFIDRRLGPPIAIHNLQSPQANITMARRKANPGQLRRSERLQTQHQQTPAQQKKRRNSLEMLRDAVAPSIAKTARAAAAKTKQLLAMATKLAKASVGEGPAVVHLHPERARRGSTYSEVDALYQNGSC
ncbi:hypothetical protein BKA80DRAFT_347154 [Phyllosticta citrichinensis]